MTALFKRLAWPAIALFSAVLLWGYATLNRRYETVVTIPVSLTGLDRNLAPSTPPPARARILVQGTGRQILMLHFSDPELLLNADKAVRGPTLFRLTPDNVEIRGATGVRVLQIKDPSAATVNFDAIITRRVPVRADVNPVTAQNHILTTDPVVAPAWVTLRGPRCNAALIETLLTRRLEITGLDRDTAVLVPLRESGVYGVTAEPAAVTVRMAVEPVKTRTFRRVPIRLIGAPPDMELDAAEASLVVAGAEKNVDTLRPDQINLFVNYSRFALDPGAPAELSVSILGEVEWSNLEPQSVKIRKKGK